MTQPLACPFCSAPRVGIDGPRHVYKCGTNLFIFEDRKPKAERPTACLKEAQRLALLAFDAAAKKLDALKTEAAK